MDDPAKKITAYLEAHRSEMTDFLATLVSINSVTYHEERAVAWLQERLEAFGYDEAYIDAAGNCAGRIGRGPAVILADAHVDTVEPGSPADWGFDPLQPRITGNTIAGRGVVDDKGPLTALIFAGRAIKELGLGEGLTYWLSASISEEDVEGSCVRAMMELNPRIKPGGIIVAEASGMKIIRGHKGRALIRMEVAGKAAHASAAWRGENALIKAIPLIQAIDRRRCDREDPFLGRGSIEVTTVICDTPSLNTIPGRATVIADRRISCGESPEELLEELKPLLELSGARAFIDTEEVTTYRGYKIEQSDYFPSWIMPEDHPLIRAGAGAYREVLGKTPAIESWSFCTNAAYLCGITGIPAIGFGPGDPALCHSPEEILSLEDLVAAAAVYAKIALNFAAAPEAAHPA
ncbi:MAG: YgeY family selenium metabolism-linked hydrolase [Treponema sp.]|jgi:putative selenium metabolism hydrolase|nr:YgeY family selenium metabolism-linked hydrolase [Treponema sp.]